MVKQDKRKVPRTFSGWGISLCWWANIKYPEMILDQLINLLFSKDGLMLNIVRYTYKYKLKFNKQNTLN